MISELNMQLNLLITSQQMSHQRLYESSELFISQKVIN